LKWKVSSQRNFSQDFRGATQSLSPVRVHRKRGVVTYRNAPCLKLCVRQRKRSISSGKASRGRKTSHFCVRVVCTPAVFAPLRVLYYLI
jgi:hypothetical protein